MRTSNLTGNNLSTATELVKCTVHTEPSFLSPWLPVHGTVLRGTEVSQLRKANPPWVSLRDTSRLVFRGAWSLSSLWERFKSHKSVWMNLAARWKSLAGSICHCFSLLLLSWWSAENPGQSKPQQVRLDDSSTSCMLHRWCETPEFFFALPLIKLSQMHTFKICSLLLKESYSCCLWYIHFF